MNPDTVGRRGQHEASPIRKIICDVDIFQRWALGHLGNTCRQYLAARGGVCSRGLTESHQQAEEQRRSRRRVANHDDDDDDDDTAMTVSDTFPSGEKKPGR